VVAAALLRILAYVLRLVGNLGYYTGRLVINLYDLAIFPSLWVESVIVGIRQRAGRPPEEVIEAEGGLAEETIEDLDATIKYGETRE